MAAALVMAAFGACSTTRTLMSAGETGVQWTLSSTPKAPKAQGTVRVARGSDGNQTIDVDVNHLPPAKTIAEGASHYVVWLVPQGGGPAQNMGLLNVGEKGGAHLTTKTPQKDFDIIVTAEADANTLQQNGERVMYATVHVPT
jgi:hypothetical protein